MAEPASQAFVAACLCKLPTPPKEICELINTILALREEDPRIQAEFEEALLEDLNSREWDSDDLALESHQVRTWIKSLDEESDY